MRDTPEYPGDVAQIIMIMLAEVPPAARWNGGERERQYAVSNPVVSEERSARLTRIKAHAPGSAECREKESMILLNFSHPLTPDQQAQLDRLTGQPVERVIDLPVQFDHQRPFVSQLAALMAAVPLSPQEWQTASLLVNPPSLNFITALVLAELHGRLGYFPPVVRLRRENDSLPPRYEVAEVLSLQVVRDEMPMTVICWNGHRIRIRPDGRMLDIQPKTSLDSLDRSFVNNVFSAFGIDKRHRFVGRFSAYPVQTSLKER